MARATPEQVADSEVQSNRDLLESYIERPVMLDSY